MKKVLVISTSPRKNSNSESLATAFAEGAGEAGHDVEFFSLRGRNCSSTVAVSPARRRSAVSFTMLQMKSGKWPCTLMCWFSPHRFTTMRCPVSSKHCWIALTRSSQATMHSRMYTSCSLRQRMRNMFLKGLSAAWRAGLTALNAPILQGRYLWAV